MRRKSTRKIDRRNILEQIRDEVSRMSSAEIRRRLAVIEQRRATTKGGDK